MHDRRFFVEADGGEQAMRYDLLRADYERLYLLERGVDPASEAARKCIAEHYPLKMGSVITELQARGLNADSQKVYYFIRKGAFHAPTLDGGHRHWTPADIDKAEDYFAAIGDYNKDAVARMIYNIDPAQDEARCQDVLAENPHVACRDHLVMTILPGMPVVDLFATVDYRPMTPEEYASWSSAIKEQKVCNFLEDCFA